MGGMGSVFKKLIPFIMLICLTTFGLTVILGNVTYLTSKNVNGTTIYSYDFVKYVKNINFKHIQSAISNVIDIDTFNKVLNGFTDLWKDGYVFGNITKTLIGVVILILDFLLTIFNIVIIVPLRIIAGILLTVLNIIGIDTTKKFWLTDVNKAILNLKTIPLINWQGGTGKNTVLVTTAPYI